MLLNVITSSPENASTHFYMIFHLESKILKRTEYNQTHYQLTLIDFFFSSLVTPVSVQNFHMLLFLHQTLLPFASEYFIIYILFWNILMTNSWNVRYRYHFVIALRAIFSLIFFFQRKIIIILLLLFTIKVFRFFFCHVCQFWYLCVENLMGS